tara:strand:- start:336 stop:650 length:315 start_codon:yes stop_codon:yes gene_type:complete
MRIFKDIFLFIRVLPSVYVSIRQDSKMMYKIMKVEKEEGSVNTFLHMFEQEMEILPKEVIQYAISNFLSSYYKFEEVDIHEKDTEALIVLEQYCIKYGVDFSER